MSLGRKILLSLIAILMVFWSFVFWWFSEEQGRMFEGQLLRQAQGIYHFLILTRLWISEKDGIYVREGEKYHRMTPSEVTIDLAGFAEEKMPFSWSIAVPDAMMPEHVPDAFEKEAIRDLGEGARNEVWRLSDENGVPVFRYAAPLVFDDACVRCHGEAGLQIYSREGDILGCVSISIPVQHLFSSQAATRGMYIVFSVGAIILLAGVLYFMLWITVLTPLSVLNKAAERIGKGDLSVRVDLKNTSEWESLGAQFNEMVAALGDRQDRLRIEIDRATNDLSKAYMDLQAIERYRSDFFSCITHDIKTPITAIKGAEEILRKTGDGTGEEYLDIIQRNVLKLTKMVQDLLDCSKIESRGLDIHRDEWDMADVVEDSILMVTPLAVKRHIVIRYEGPRGTTCRAFIDPSRMEQAVSNLLSNAIKFSPEGSEVLIRLEGKKDGELVVSVEDFGEGIAEQERELVFQKFFRRTGEKAGDGMGLGLAIARGIVEAHGGRIWISSPADHQGTVFHISLPCS